MLPLQIEGPAVTVPRGHFVMNAAKSSYSAQYDALVHKLIGCPLKPSRQAGATTRSLTGEQIRARIGDRVETSDGHFELHNFPNLACKRVPLYQVFAELAWFMRGSTNANELNRAGCKIWDADAAKAGARGHDVPPGELGPIYGYQWRLRADGDQLRKAVDMLAAAPYGRRNLVVSWQCDGLRDMVLPPCHYAFQFVCQPRADNPGSVTVDCAVTMRSTDVGLGLPFNVASYAMLTTVACAEAERLADVCDHRVGGAGARTTRFFPGEVVVTMGDCHIYEEHIAPLHQAIEDQMFTEAAPCSVSLPVNIGIDEFAALDRDSLERIASFTGDRPPRVPLKLYT
jgi:thymidylate synthase